MSRLWKTCKLMSHHEYSYQASGVPLLLISNHQWGLTGAVYDQCYLKANLPCSKPHLCSQLWYQKSLWAVIYLRDHLWSFWDGPCSLEVTMEKCSLLSVLFPALLQKRKQAELFRALFWLFPHHVQDIHVLSSLRDTDSLIPKGSCGVKLKIFLVGSFPHQFHTELMLRVMLCSGGCWVNRCVMPWNCGMCWKLMERGFLTMFCWAENGISHGWNLGRALIQ